MSSITRIEVLKKELSALGYSYTLQVVANVAYTKFTSPQGKKWMYCDDAGTLPMPYASSSYILNSKTNSIEFVRSKGFRVPASVAVSETIQSTAEYRRLLGLSEGASLVVKPADGTLSQGVTANVINDEQLRAAILTAKQRSHSVLVQERYEGEELRFTFVAGELRSVIYKQKPRIVGNGALSIRELILDENADRLHTVLTTIKYPLLNFEKIQAFGIDLMYVPQDKEVVLLGDSTMIEHGASMYELLGEVDESYVSLASQMAADFGGGYLATDLLIRNYNVPADDDNYCFLEFNNLPAMSLFYTCRNGIRTDVGHDLAGYIDKVLHVQ